MNLGRKTITLRRNVKVLSVFRAFKSNMDRLAFSSNISTAYLKVTKRHENSFVFWRKGNSNKETIVEFISEWLCTPYIYISETPSKIFSREILKFIEELRIHFYSSTMYLFFSGDLQNVLCLFFQYTLSIFFMWSVSWFFAPHVCSNNLLASEKRSVNSFMTKAPIL